MTFIAIAADHDQLISIFSISPYPITISATTCKNIPSNVPNEDPNQPAMHLSSLISVHCLHEETLYP